MITKVTQAEREKVSAMPAATSKIHVRYPISNNHNRVLLIVRRTSTIHRQVSEQGAEDRYRVLVNIGNYRQRQEESLQALARRSAERVRFTKKPITLPVLSAYDRRIVHMTLQQEPDVVGESEGEGRDRRLVVRLRDE